MNKKQAINQSINGIITQLIPSSIVGAGVGVKCLTEIYKDEIVFKPENNCFIAWREIHHPPHIINYIKKICNHNEHGFWIDCLINNIGSAYFVNHSEVPNLFHDKQNDTYYALRDIEIGEELTCLYSEDEMDWI